MVEIHPLTKEHNVIIWMTKTATLHPQMLFTSPEQDDRWEAKVYTHETVTAVDVQKYLRDYVRKPSL